ncbi:MAG: magnetosome biogenesis CDF transporter MamM [Magnetococcales bacterium]|nr:magnetosome biogenesis CDF transporter MamM [Magnetococcales bacterium]
MSYAKCIVCYRFVGWVGLLTNLALSVLKIFVGILSGSHALLVDALYSGKDVITSFLIILGLKFAKKPLDDEHRFGYGKIEFLLSMVIGIILVVVTLLFLIYAAGNLMETEHQTPHLIALWTAVFIVAVNIYLRYYTRCVAHNINSPMVMVLSQHHEADGWSSLAVALGIIGSHYLGMPWLDTAVAVFECIHLLYLGGQVILDSYKGLMDDAASPEVVQHIQEVSENVDGVQRIENIRTRRVGQEVWIFLEIGVNPDISIGDANAVSLQVEQRLIESIPHVGDITIQFRSAEGSLPEFGEIKKEISVLREQVDQESQQIQGLDKQQPVSSSD